MSNVNEAFVSATAAFWVAFEPVEVVKSNDPDPKKQLLGKVRGIATVELPDKVNGDIIDLDTIQTDYLIKSGVFTYEHPRGVINTVGFPTSASVVDHTTSDGKKTRALELEGYLYLNDDLGAAIYYKSKTMKDAGGQRAIGWSLEGPGVVRTSELKLPSRRVMNHEPKAVAICLEPANEYALWSVAASAAGNRPVDGSDATLPVILAKTAVLRDQTQLHHWNVVGPTFSQLHALFGSQYDDLADAVDGIAERIRQMGQKIDPMTIAGLSSTGDASVMVAELATSNANLSALCSRGAAVADSAGDAATVDLLGKRAAVHAKAAWMLRSTLGIGEDQDVDDLVSTTSAARDYVSQFTKSARSVNAPRGSVCNNDRHISMLLKSFPTLSWAQGEQWVAEIRNAVHQVVGHKE